jgi:hypothetical protein
MKAIALFQAIWSKAASREDSRAFIRDPRDNSVRAGHNSIQPR